MPKFEKSTGDLYYAQVSDYVREKIYSKEWGVDEPIPSEHELMSMLDLSRGTVQKGIRQLVDEGLLVQQRGRGTFVVQPVMASPTSNKLLSFGESMTDLGVDYTTCVVTREVRSADAVCAENLQIDVGDPYLFLCRVRYVRARPVMFLESHVNISVCPGLENEDFTEHTLFYQVEKTSGRKIGRSELVYNARVVGKKRGAYLDSDEHAPALEIDQLVRLDNGVPFEWGSVWLPANRCVISNATQRTGN